MLYLRALRGIVYDNPWRVKDDEAQKNSNRDPNARPYASLPLGEARLVPIRLGDFVRFSSLCEFVCVSPHRVLHPIAEVQRLRLACESWETFFVLLPRLHGAPRRLLIV